MGLLATTAFSSIHLPFTILLILVLVYWVTVILGVIDLETIDVDLDSDLDVDAGLDADVDADADISGAGEGFSILKFFYIGELPLMILASLFIASTWFVSIISNYIFNPGMGSYIALCLLLPNFVFSAFVVKVVGKPFSKIFTTLNKDLKGDRQMVGMPCVVMTTKVTESFGQAQVETGTSPIIFNAITRNKEVLKKGDSAVILEHLEDKNTYIITSFD